MTPVDRCDRRSMPGVRDTRPDERADGQMTAEVASGRTPVAAGVPTPGEASRPDGGPGRSGGTDPGGLPRSPARAVVIAPLAAYQRWVSPALPRRCKFEPTCSRYAVEAIGQFGILRGVVLAAWRLLRCNPWSHGGFDPPDRQRLFRPRPAPPSANR